VRPSAAYRKDGELDISDSCLLDLSGVLRSITEVADILLLFDLLWFANRTMLEPMDQSPPPRPALFLRLMLVVKPSRFGELFSDFWVTHPHARNLFPSLMPARSHPRRGFTGTRHALPDSMSGSSQYLSGLAALSKIKGAYTHARVTATPIETQVEPRP